MTVLQYLRDIAGLTGTKEGCAEGDCGACTVVIGELSEPAAGDSASAASVASTYADTASAAIESADTKSASTESISRQSARAETASAESAGTGSADRRRGAAPRMTYRAVNSCIRFLPTLDGKELITVEGLRQPSEAPQQPAQGLQRQPAQDPRQPSADGFEPCTAHPVQQSMLDHHASQCGFCTPGFVMSLFALYLNRDTAEREDIVAALAGNLCRCTGYRPIIDAGMRQWEYPAPARWSREDAHSAPHVEALQAIARGAEPAASLRYPDYHAPRTLTELSDALEARPDALVLAGGTDVGLWVTKQLRDLPPLIYVGDVAELARIERRDVAHGRRELWIGAAVTLTDAWPALLREFPELDEQAARFASPPIRNSATLCGNVANGSPIGDSIPALLALDAHVELRCGARLRRLPLDEFYLGYQKKALAAGEFVAAVAIPLPANRRLLASYKVSKRIDQDISAVCATFCVELDGRRVTHARLAYGGLAATARRARHAELALLETGWTPEGIESASAALATDFQPLSDLRASSTYRLRAAGNLLQRFYLQQQRPTPQAEHAALALRTADALAQAENPRTGLPAVAPAAVPGALEDASSAPTAGAPAASPTHMPPSALRTANVSTTASPTRLPPSALR
ncbi:MAG: xanthine dehydrogenase small subunit [Pseudomonadota bacterium]|nr:xanthine dehydrogenase small subunit [Pseudomonadota bacterium]